MVKHTPGPWRARELGSEGARIMPDYGDVRERGKTIADVRGRDTLTDFANARLIAAAVNSCFQINPDNPLAVAEALPELVEATQSVMIKLCDLMNPGLDRPRPDLEEMHDGLAAALAKIGAKGE